MPFDELLREILLIVEAAHFEEGRLYETRQVFNGTLLLRTMRPTQLHPDAQLGHDVKHYTAPAFLQQTQKVRSVIEPVKMEHRTQPKFHDSRSC
jgi:hypothetical protein